MTINTITIATTIAARRSSAYADRVDAVLGVVRERALSRLAADPATAARDAATARDTAAANAAWDAHDGHVYDAAHAVYMCLSGDGTPERTALVEAHMAARAAQSAAATAARVNVTPAIEAAAVAAREKHLNTTTIAALVKAAWRARVREQAAWAAVDAETA